MNDEESNELIETAEQEKIQDDDEEVGHAEHAETVDTTTTTDDERAETDDSVEDAVEEDELIAF